MPPKKKSFKIPPRKTMIRHSERAIPQKHRKINRQPHNYSSKKRPKNKKKKNCKTSPFIGPCYDKALPLPMLFPYELEGDGKDWINNIVNGAQVIVTKQLD